MEHDTSDACDANSGTDSPSVWCHLWRVRGVAACRLFQNGTGLDHDPRSLHDYTRWDVRPTPPDHDPGPQMGTHLWVPTLLMVSGNGPGIDHLAYSN